MWNSPSQEQLNSIPNLYETEHVPFQDKTIHLHLFIGGCDWYIAETDGDIAFGFVILNDDYVNAEWGLISLPELEAIRIHGWLEVDNDLYWEPRPASAIGKIRQAHGWAEQGGECYVR